VTTSDHFSLELIFAYLESFFTSVYFRYTLQVFAFFADQRVTLRRSSSGRCRLLPYRRQSADRRPAPWRVRLAVRDLQPSRRLPPPMSVPAQRTRRFRCVFDLRRCRRHLVPSSLSYSSSAANSRAASRLLDDVDDFDNVTEDPAPPDCGPLIVVKHFCKVPPSSHFFFLRCIVWFLAVVLRQGRDSIGERAVASLPNFLVVGKFSGKIFVRKLCPFESNKIEERGQLAGICMYCDRVVPV